MMEAYAAATGFDKAIITDAYRSFDFQQALSSKSSSAAGPGYSDYHSGATFYIEHLQPFKPLSGKIVVA